MEIGKLLNKKEIRKPNSKIGLIKKLGVNLVNPVEAVIDYIDAQVNAVGIDTSTAFDNAEEWMQETFDE